MSMPYSFRASGFPLDEYAVSTKIAKGKGGFASSAAMGGTNPDLSLCIEQRRSFRDGDK